jgi:hypothetical protein
MTINMSEVPEIGSERGTVMVSAAWKISPPLEYVYGIDGRNG